MPKTVQSDESTKRFNPYIKKSISKTLLTPCRQIGLSRKKKTPNSSFRSSLDGADPPDSVTLNTTPVSSRKSSSESISIKLETQCHTQSTLDKTVNSTPCPNESITVVKESKSGTKSHKSSFKDKTKASSETSSNTTAVTSRQSNEHDKPSEETIPLKSTKFDKVKVKKKVSKCLIKDDSSEDDLSLASLKQNNSNEKGLENGISVMDPDVVDSDFSVNKCKDTIKQYENKTKKKVSILTKIPETEDKIVKSISPTLQMTHAKDENSVKRTSVLQEIQHEDNTASQLQAEEKIVKSTSHSLERENSTRTEKKRKIKRSLSMKKSSEEIEKNKRDIVEDRKVTDCTVYLSPLESKSDVKIPPDLSPQIDVNDVRRLEHEVKEKKKLFEELQQAEIYRKLHDVDKLKELTATWKKGCIAALNDLLPQVQAHANIDMATLLNNMRVPKELVSLSESGDLI